MKKKVDYKKSVSKDLRNIDHSHRIRVVNQIEHELSEDPSAGKPLQGNFKGLLSFRCGDYRVIYKLTNESILILRISHRKDVYDH